jgi:hypothetical protein
MAKSLRRLLVTFAIAVPFFAPVTRAFADGARFDLIGPKVEVRVSRAGKELPIAYVPNLQPGDKLWLHPDLPPSQSVHYLLIVAFLRGNTNPPPDEWFTRIETWRKDVADEGVTVVVPNEAQQAILFLAPETGGDFSTLRKAVRGRPGIFVRASQDLSEAGFEQARIEKYIASIRRVPPSDSKALLEHSDLLARTLNLKPNEDCFKRPVDMQYNCLTQSGNQTLLDDGHAESMVSLLSNGSNADFITAASYTSIAGGGTYSAYVGAVVDLARILGGLHTAQYQYIPAIAFPDQESLNLRLNTPPSFRNPKSVIVIGLPSIQKAVPPPLRPADPKEVSCLVKPNLVLQVDGAPLVFSTAFAHDLVLHIEGSNPSIDLPLTPDAFRGGLVLAPVPTRKPLPMTSETSVVDPASPAAAPAPGSRPEPPSAKASPEVTGIVKGMWGFDDFTGPTLLLQNAPGGGWRLASDKPLIAGRENHVTLVSNGSACVDRVALEVGHDSPSEAKWKLEPNTDKASSDPIDVTLPLKATDPGSINIVVHQYGDRQPVRVAAHAFSEPATLEALELHADDSTAVLTGTSLNQVQQLNLADLTFAPLPNSDSSSSQSLRLSLPFGVSASKLHAGDKLTASCTLKDGRTLTLPVTIAPARPNLTLLNKSIGHVSDSPIQLGNQDDLPANLLLTFSLKSSAPFLRTTQIEVANSDESLKTYLSVQSGTLVLQNPHTVLATLDPLKAFGASAFGSLHLRAVAADGTTGDWLPLATLVRLPDLSNLRCTTDPAAPCTLSGSSLYLVDAISPDPTFTAPTSVPDGFVGSTLSIPRPTGLPATLSATRPTNTTLYLRLRDDPSAPNTTTIPVLPAPADSARGNAQPKPGVSATAVAAH